MKNEKNYIKEKIANNIKSYRENEELIELYYKYIEELVELFDLLFKNNSDLFYTTVFDLLVNRGFFSFNHKPNINSNNPKELLIKPGISVVNGNYCCRNIACFYEDIFMCFYHYPLKICCYDSKNESNELSQLYGNHMINITKHNDTLYGFDLLNHCLLTFTDKDLLNGFGFNYPLIHVLNGDLLIKMTTNFDYRRNLENELKKEKEIFEKAYLNKIISNEEYIKILMKAKTFIKENEHILQSFMFKNNELTHEIKKKMLLLK